MDAPSRRGEGAGRYWLAQVPGWGIAFVALALAWSYLGLPGWAAIALGLLLVAKDVLLYPLSMRALRSPPRSGAAALVDARGTATEPLAPGADGRVRIGAELWQAKLAAGEAPLAAGAAVRVEDVRGLLLVVRAAPEDER